MKVDVHDFHRHRGILVSIVSYAEFVDDDSIRGGTFKSEYSDQEEVGEPNRLPQSEYPNLSGWQNLRLRI